MMKENKERPPIRFFYACTTGVRPDLTKIGITNDAARRREQHELQFGVAPSAWWEKDCQGVIDARLVETLIRQKGWTIIRGELQPELKVDPNWSAQALNSPTEYTAKTMEEVRGFVEGCLLSPSSVIPEIHRLKKVNQKLWREKRESRDPAYRQRRLSGARKRVREWNADPANRERTRRRKEEAARRRKAERMASDPEYRRKVEEQERWKREYPNLEERKRARADFRKRERMANDPEYRRKVEENERWKREYPDPEERKRARKRARRPQEHQRQRERMANDSEYRERMNAPKRKYMREHTRRLRQRKLPEEFAEAAEGLVAKYLELISPDWAARPQIGEAVYQDYLKIGGSECGFPEERNRKVIEGVLIKLVESGKIMKRGRMWRLRTAGVYFGLGVRFGWVVARPLIEEYLQEPGVGKVMRPVIMKTVFARHLERGGIPGAEPMSAVKKALNDLKADSRIKNPATGCYCWPTAEHPGEYHFAELPFGTSAARPLIEEYLQEPGVGKAMRPVIVKTVLARHLERGGIPGAEPTSAVKKALNDLKADGRIKNPATGCYCWPTAEHPGEYHFAELPFGTSAARPLIEEYLQEPGVGKAMRPVIVKTVLARHLERGGIPGAEPTSAVKKALNDLKADGRIKNPATGCYCWPTAEHPGEHRLDSTVGQEDLDYAGIGLPPTAGLILPLIEKFMKDKLSSSPLGWTERPEIVEVVYKQHLAMGGEACHAGLPTGAVKSALRTLKAEGKIALHNAGCRSKVRWAGVPEIAGTNNHTDALAPAKGLYIPPAAGDIHSSGWNGESASDESKAEKPDRLEFGDPQAKGTVYAFYNPAEREMYRQRHSGTEDYPLKIGKTDTPDWEKRLERQSQTLLMKPEVVLVYRTDTPGEWEALLHKALKLQGRHMKPESGGGTEWFRTNPEHVKRIIDRNQPEA